MGAGALDRWSRALGVPVPPSSSGAATPLRDILEGGGRGHAEILAAVDRAVISENGGPATPFDPHDVQVRQLLQTARLAGAGADPALAMDVHRAFPGCAALCGVARAHLQRILLHIVASVLEGDERLHYYQGLHDVGAVILFEAVSLVRKRQGQVRIRATLAAAVLERLLASFLRDFCAPSLSPALEHVCAIAPLVHAADAAAFALVTASLWPGGGETLFRARVSPRMESDEAAALQLCREFTPSFALSWTLTWFAHDMDVFLDADSHSALVALWDALLELSPAAPAYAAAALVAAARPLLVKALFPAGRSSVDGADVHAALSRLPRLVHCAGESPDEVFMRGGSVFAEVSGVDATKLVAPLQIDRIIAAARALYAAHPPQTGRGTWPRWSADSAVGEFVARHGAAAASFGDEEELLKSDALRKWLGGQLGSVGLAITPPAPESATREVAQKRRGRRRRLFTQLLVSALVVGAAVAWSRHVFRHG